ncbi:STE/STE7 protein kinase [Thecamonas trahens ATCC 50062]|uniref:mitogen-activated protein kinase kinase n=1 Tax=Thecamonas trahens ATCC 50062 TaxID=461836 RepID=A0A0L0DWL2_THETB|nr:STE/STE7 protein kinase [Thecamonas trahens ATCC 50062]KNC56481.1 STE/STE7 protein kinase [Thecamonas trahens ATCC 50062]|eukprot:XP_013760990.1 STE/STE7 protein kinase [Thecamonas trahens ATCC 50062]
MRGTRPRVVVSRVQPEQAAVDGLAGVGQRGRARHGEQQMQAKVGPGSGRRASSGVDEETMSEWSKVGCGAEAWDGSDGSLPLDADAGAGEQMRSLPNSPTARPDDGMAQAPEGRMRQLAVPDGGLVHKSHRRVADDLSPATTASSMTSSEMTGSMSTSSNSGVILTRSSDSCDEDACSSGGGELHVEVKASGSPKGVSRLALRALSTSVSSLDSPATTPGSSSPSERMPSWRRRPPSVLTPTFASTLPDGTMMADGVLIDCNNNVCLSDGGFVYYEPQTRRLHALLSPSMSKRVQSRMMRRARKQLLERLPAGERASVEVVHDVGLGHADVFGSKGEGGRIKELGSGAFGTVALYRAAADDTLVAVKRMRLEYDVRNQHVSRRILTECKLLHATSSVSKDIVKFRGAFVVQHGMYLRLYLCMEYMDLGSLASVRKKWGPVPEGPLADMAAMLLRGLRYLQTACVMHRDLRPENVLLNTGGRAKVADLGHAKSLESESGKLSAHSKGVIELSLPEPERARRGLVPLAHSPIGNKLYMAPERLDTRRRVSDSELQVYDEKCDIWSLGLVLRVAAMASDGYPYDVSEAKTHLDVAQLIVESSAPRMPRDVGLTRDFCDFVDACMAKDPRHVRLRSSCSTCHSCSTPSSRTGHGCGCGRPTCCSVTRSSGHGWRSCIPMTRRTGTRRRWTRRGQTRRL